MISITSFSYLAFLAVILTGYYLIKPAWQSVYLLIASVGFYCLSAKPYTIIYLIISIVSVYYAAVMIGKATVEKKRKRILVCALILNFGMLVLLKYNLLGVSTRLTASLGISYYTLQLTGYLLDCYWKVGIVQTDFKKFALFACYFPQMTSGPISRYKQIQQSLYEPHTFDYGRVTHGLRRMAWGLFKKMVIADRLGLIVDSVYTHYESYHVLLIWAGIFCFAIQLYADFSGCMDVVLGTAECMGIYLPENFKNPFFSRTIQEFWQRWHITLGTWLKDYIMDPVLKSEVWIKLGEHSRKRFGKKWGKRIPTYCGMLILWLAMGIWHGNGWKYIVGEGLWFWFVIILGNMCGKSLQGIVRKLHIPAENICWITFQRLRTFFIFSIGLVCFRAENMRQVFNMLLSGVTQFGERGFSQIKGDLGYVNLILLCIAFLVFVMVENTQNRGIDIFERLAEQNALIRWCCYLFVCGMILLSLGGSGQSFIYAGF
ncbi:MAG: hypothetical protein NC231_01295 [Bacillus sp. (in: Bacteria)]|nr:hypothetical protein [Bacillus sp. (in: firmicutes)]MCM1425459.1 hypothetical protein [Eubacterium sp.]